MVSRGRPGLIGLRKTLQLSFFRLALHGLVERVHLGKPRYEGYEGTSLHAQPPSTVLPRWRVPDSQTQAKPIIQANRRGSMLCPAALSCCCAFPGKWTSRTTWYYWLFSFRLCSPLRRLPLPQLAIGFAMHGFFGRSHAPKKVPPR